MTEALTIRTLFLSADSNKVLPLLKQFIDAGGDVNDVDPTSGLTLLRIACEHKNFELIAELGRLGVNPDATSGRDGWTAMHHAVDIDIDSVWQATHPTNLAEKLTFDTVRALANIGARFDILDAKSRTPLDISASYDKDVSLKLEALISEIS